MTPITAVYADGGVISHNPSRLGGTYAWRHVGADGLVVAEKAVAFSPADVMVSEVTNNLTELMAVLAALRELPKGWAGTVYSDSQVTLGRVFEGWKLNNLPGWITQRLGRVLQHIDVAQTRYVLLDGHPTKAQLLAGVGKRGNPVSEHNVWCDKACQEQAAAFLARERRAA